MQAAIFNLVPAGGSHASLEQQAHAMWLAFPQARQVTSQKQQVCLEFSSLQFLQVGHVVSCVLLLHPESLLAAHGPVLCIWCTASSS